VVFLALVRASARKSTVGGRSTFQDGASFGNDVTGCLAFAPRVREKGAKMGELPIGATKADT